MAFRRISNASTANEVLFLNQWIEQVGEEKFKKRYDGTIFPLRSISKVRSGKGYMCNAEKFTIFVWNNSNEGKEIANYLSEDVDGIMSVLIDFEMNSRYQLGIDDANEVSILETKENCWLIKSTPFTNEELNEQVIDLVEHKAKLVTSTAMPSVIDNKRVAPKASKTGERKA